MKVRGEPLTAEFARQLFSYDPDTGVVTRKTSLPRHYKAGEVVNSLTGRAGLPRYKVTVNNIHYLLHRVIWLMETGEWPKHVIDHIDGDGTNNKWCNLRDVPPRINAQNVRTSKANALGLSGVKQYGSRFRAKIVDKGVDHYLGMFDTSEEAYAAYIAAKKSMHKGFVPQRMSAPLQKGCSNAE